jgi:TetR/AcrR family transcriptional repressor of nem operon
MSAEPRTSRGRATRDRILTAATTLISERGVAGTSLDGVCALADCSKSQLYLYFEDRENLLRAVARATAEQVMAMQAGGLKRCDTVEGIRAYLDAIVEIQVARQARGGCPIGSLAGQLAETDESARAELAAGMAEWQTGLSTGLAAMAERGDLTPGTDAETLATQTLALIQGGLVLTQVHRDPQKIRTAADGALELISQAATARA